MGNGHIRYEYLGTGHYLSPWGGGGGGGGDLSLFGEQNGGGVGGGSLAVFGEQNGGSVVT